MKRRLRRMRRLRVLCGLQMRRLRRLHEAGREAATQDLFSVDRTLIFIYASQQKGYALSSRLKYEKKTKHDSST